MNSYIYNKDAETSLIGSILIDGELIKEIEAKPEHFYFTQNRAVYEAMKALDDKGEPVDVVTVVTELGNEKTAQIGGVSYISDLAGSVPSTANVKYYEKLVVDAWKKRAAAEISEKLKNELAAGGDTESINTAIKELVRVEETGYMTDFDLKGTLLTVYDQILNGSNDITGIDTGYKELNNITKGWQDGDLIIVGARPSVGKTAFALNSAMAAGRNETIVSVFSLEMGAGALLKRCISTLGNIDAGRMINANKNFKDNDWDKLAHAIAILEKMDLYIYDKPGVTVQEIRAKIRKLKQKHPDKRHLCVIDYLQLVTGSGNQNRTQEVGEISRALKIMARDYEIPIIALSQLSRAVESRQEKRPMLSDLRESGNVEQDADVIGFLYRDDYYNADSEAKNIIEIIVAKQRNGPTGTVELAFLKEFNKFVDLEKRRE